MFDSQTIADRLRPLKGAPCWNVKRGYGSFLTLEFGQPHLQIHGPTRRRKRGVFVKGEYHLWVQMCSWDILFDGRVVARSESTDEAIDSALGTIDSMCLERLRCDAREKRASFRFESGAEISMCGYDDFAPDSAIWILFMPTGYFAFLTSGDICHSPDGSDQTEALRFRHIDLALGPDDKEMIAGVE